MSGLETVHRVLQRPQRLPALIAVIVGAWAIAPHVMAAEIDTGNDDLKVRLDNKLSFTAGWRVGSRDDAIAANPALGAAVASEYFADKGKLYTTRFDLYSEFDLKYKNDHGFRLSGALWSDPKFPSQPNVGPAGVANSPFGPSGDWPHEVKRYYGNSGEMLDAFAFTRLDSVWVILAAAAAGLAHAVMVG